MKRCCCFIFGSLLLFAAFSFSGGFWQKENYSSWNEKETKKILEDSPWARLAKIKQDMNNLKRASRNAGEPSGGSGGFGGGGMGGGGGFGGGGMGGGGGFGGGGMGGGGGFGGGGFGGGGFGGGMGSQPKVIMRWYSALPVKQATMRLKYKDEVKTSEEAAKSLNRKETGYILCVVGLPGMKQVYNADDIEKNSMIKLKGRSSILPAEVAVEQEGRTVSLYLFFPKFKHDGTPLITLKDGSIEVLVEAWMYDLKRKFKLKDMVYNGNLEL
jgi:hypothetical protein